MKSTMKFLMAAVALLTVAVTALADDGQCIAGPNTQTYQAPFCNIVTDGADHCQAIGCVWVRLVYSCVAGPNTQTYQAPFCNLVTDGADHCQIVGCEWQGQYVQ